MFNIEDIGAVRRLTIDNPGRKNAIPPDQWPVLAGRFTDFEDSQQRALVITGGEGDFCSGADLGVTEMGKRSTATRYGMMMNVAAAVTALRKITKPTVAAVDGVAVGAGMNMAIGCDIVIATPTARFAEIFVKRGLTVDFGGTWILPRLVGLAKAKELALTGRIVSGEEALALGLVTRLAEPEDLPDAALATAAQLAAGAPLAQRFIKIGLERSFDMTFEQALAYEDQAQAICLSSEDVVEGVSAFLAKRDPEFKGR